METYRWTVTSGENL